MSSPFSKWFLKHGFRFGLGIIIIIAFLYYGQKQSLQSSFAWVLHSSRAQQELTDFSQSIEISNKQSTINEHYEHLKNLLSDNSRQMVRLQAIKDLLDRKEVLLSEKGIPEQDRFVRADGIDEEILTIIGEMRAEESRILQDREELSKRNIFLLDLPIIIGALFACFLIYAANRITRRDLKELLKKDQELETYAAELKQSNENLQMQSNAMDFTVEAMADGVVVVNEKREFLRFNKVARQLLGFGPEDVRVRGLGNLPMKNSVTKNFLSTEELPISRALRGESVTDLEVLVEIPGEPHRVVSFNTQPVFNQEKAMIGAIAVFRDITTRKALENELRNAQQAAIETAEMKSRFLANMSHEIRTPMNGIIGMTELLSQTTVDEKQKAYVNLINESCQNLLTIINDILDFSKIEAGKLEIEKTDFNLAYALDRTVQLLVTKAREKSLVLLSYVSPEIPMTVRGDSGRLGQILVNLLSNALKFTSVGKVLVEANLVQTKDGIIEVKFSVRDTGVGIPSEQIHRLFQPFTQVDTSTSRKFGGTGLGLSICKQLVDLMGGKIGVESKPGEGTLFWFTIPFEFPTDVAPSPHRHFVSETQILIYDEDPDSARILKGYLGFWKIPLIHLKEINELQGLIEDAGDLSHHHLMLVCGPKNHDQIKNALKLIGQRASRPEITLVIDTDDSRILDQFQVFGVDHYLFRPVQQNTLYNHLIHLSSEDNVLEDISPADDSKMEPEAEERPLKSGRILLAEDNSVNQMIAQAFLKELGHSTHIVSNGKEAIDALKQSEYDLILMDCQMPEMDGFEATEYIRSKVSAKIPIIALTANAMKGDEERCRKAGMNAYLSKPFHKDQLQALLQKYLPKIYSPFDPGRLEMFRGYKDDNNRDLRKALIESYLQTAPESIVELKKFYKDQPEQFRRIAHTLKSSTASVGGFYLARIFEELELGVPDHSVIEKKLSDVQQEYQKLQQHLISYAAGIS